MKFKAQCVVFLTLLAWTKAQDLLMGPVMAAPLVTSAPASETAHQIFSNKDFDLAGKQVKFIPHGSSGSYLLTTESLHGLVDLDETWEIAEDVLAVSLGFAFPYASSFHVGVNLHPAGYLIFNDSETSWEADCLNSSTYVAEDVIVALCSTGSVSLVRHTVFDDRLVAQWALPFAQCATSTSSLGPTPASAPGPVGAYMLIAQVELLADGMITLSWMGKTPCQTAVGIGKVDAKPNAVAFSQLSPELGPAAPDCTKFTVSSGAYSCQLRKAVFLPSALPPVVLFAGQELAEQQVLTIVNAAGQQAAETGTLPPPPISPAPASPAGLSRSARGLQQAPVGISGGGLGLLQRIETTIANSLRNMAPTLAQEILGFNSSLLGLPLAPDQAAVPAPTTLPGPTSAVTAPKMAPLVEAVMTPRLEPVTAPMLAPTTTTLLAPPTSLMHGPMLAPMTGLATAPVAASPVGMAEAPGNVLNPAPSPKGISMPSPSAALESGKRLNGDPTTIVLNGPSSVVIGGATPVGPQSSSGRRLLQGVLVPANSVAPGPAVFGPAVAPLSIEAGSGGVAAVGIKETPPPSVTRALEFLPAESCSQPRQPGPCDRFSTRWYYDPATNACTEFVFGGCLGNLNNFATLLACQQACIAGTQPPKEVETTGEVSIPGPDELVFLANALIARKWITLDATSLAFLAGIAQIEVLCIWAEIVQQLRPGFARAGVLPAGAAAALHILYNGTGQALGSYLQTITLSSNDPQHTQTKFQVAMHLFCGRLQATYLQQPMAPEATYSSLSGSKPGWAVGFNLTDLEAFVYFEIHVVANAPILELKAQDIEVDAGGAEGVVISIGDIESSSYGPMCSAWVVRGAAPLPDYYAYGTEGVLLTTSFSGLETVFGETVPPTSANKTLFNTLPQCTLYAQGMTFGGDFGLVVDSNFSSARAVLVCTAPLQGLCADCIRPMHTSHDNEADDVEVTFFGEVPGKAAQYDIEISWPAGSFFGGVNLTVTCNATDDQERPLAAVAPLPFAIVARSQLKPTAAEALPPAMPMYPPGPDPYGTGPRPGSNATSTGPRSASPAASPAAAPSQAGSENT